MMKENQEMGIALLDNELWVIEIPLFCDILILHK